MFLIQKPLDLGADIVMYSLTKYMNGHTDVIMGAAITRRDDLAQKLRSNQIGKLIRAFLDHAFKHFIYKQFFLHFPIQSWELCHHHLTVP